MCLKASTPFGRPVLEWHACGFRAVQIGHSARHMVRLTICSVRLRGIQRSLTADYLAGMAAAR